MMKGIVDEIRSKHSFLITAHENPDGDAVGSSLALANYLIGLGKDVTVYFCDRLPELYAYLPLSEMAVDTLPDRDYDVCFVLDVGEFRRAGEAITGCSRIGTFINVDHHLSCEHFGAHNLIDSQAAATGVLVYRIIKEAGGEIGHDAAICIYTAIITDTGGFRYSNSNREAFTVAGEMIDAGVNAWYVAEHLYESQPKARLDLLALSLATLTVSEGGRCASIDVTLDMFAATGTDAEITDGFINYPRSIKGVEVALFFREIRPGYFKVGFRSKGKVNVAALAELFNGGGHHNAAGCTVAGTLEEVKRQVLHHLDQAL